MTSDEIRAFLLTIDSELTKEAHAGETLPLYLLGSSALILAYNFQLMTKDVDVVHDHASRLLKIVEERFGKNGSQGVNLLYIETVSSGLPPLPSGYQQRCVDLLGDWKVIRPKLPEAHDLIVTKLKRFHAGDRRDIRLLCEMGKIVQTTLRERFLGAYQWVEEDLPETIQARINLERVCKFLSGELRSL